MAIQLRKGQRINLEKKCNDLSKVTIGLGWKIRAKEQGFLAKLFGSKEEDYDLDAIAVLLNENDKITHKGDVVFFNNKRHPSGAVWSCGDNLVGGDGTNDDEQIVCLLDRVPRQYEKIVFLVSIYQGQQKHQRFGDVESAYIRAVDARGTELARYSLSDESSAAEAQTVIFAALSRHGEEWEFQAIGNAHQTQSFVDVLPRYM